MITKVAKIENKLGIHARPASLFVKTAGQFESDIRIEKDGVEVNGKSIMSVMMLAAEKGSEITITAEGVDEKEAIDSLIKLVEERKFDEE
ncbi:HPr family phosphocarrier protein [candidate division WOR-3 bacterium]|nr:HPr family phosphocarrier protein [candidate division WOR-3 bacterium]TET77274.1 MAG: HPr family phosphocarrier protein [Candidatus Cloacimonadota bacterium]